jgi:hypothetical protein
MAHRLLLGALVACTSACAPFLKPSQVTHISVVTSLRLTSTDTVFVAGGPESLGGWKPNKVPMKRVNDTLWTVAAKDLPKGFSYKFTLGSWDAEARIAGAKPWRDLQGQRGRAAQRAKAQLPRQALGRRAAQALRDLGQARAGPDHGLRHLGQRWKRYEEDVTS